MQQLRRPNPTLDRFIEALGIHLTMELMKEAYTVSDNLDWLAEPPEAPETFINDPANEANACYCMLWPGPHNECYYGEGE